MGLGSAVQGACFALMSRDLSCNPARGSSQAVVAAAQLFVAERCSSHWWHCPRTFNSIAAESGTTGSSSSPHSSSAGSGGVSASTSSANDRISAGDGHQHSSEGQAGSFRQLHTQPAQLSGQQWSAEEIKAVRAQIFEHLVGDGRRSGRKAILKPMKGRHIADWYFTLTGPKMPMLVDDVEEERQLRADMARATGSGPPKKGQGKRAKK